MLYRQFVEQTKDAAATVAGGIRGGRDLTPMVHLESEGTVESLPLDPGFFADDDGRRSLTDTVVRLVEQARPEQVAWTFTGTHSTRQNADDEWDRQEVLLVIVVDRERYEIWRAPLYRRDDSPPVIGGWVDMANRGTGFLVTPIQEALR